MVGVGSLLLHCQICADQMDANSRVSNARIEGSTINLIDSGMVDGVVKL